MKYLLATALGLSIVFANWSGCSEMRADAPGPGSEQISFYQKRLHDYLLKDSVLAQQLLIYEAGIRIYPAGTPSDTTSPEATIYWDEIDDFVRMVRELPQEEALALYLAKGNAGFTAAMRRSIPKNKRPKALEGPPETPLKGWRIAIDPGHVGGSMDFAFLEKKFVRIERGDRPGIDEAIAFNEGNLALGTALLLRDTLQKLGAEVLLTRSEEGMTPFGGDFADWLASEYKKAEAEQKVDWTAFRGHSPEGYAIRNLRAAAWNHVRANGIQGRDSTWWMSKSSARDVYKIPFLKADFRERARLINAFRPDLSLIVHYNIYEANTWDRGKFLHAVDGNHSMAFIPGSFMAGELREPEERMLFLYKLLSEDLPASERLSAAVVQGFEEDLGVPAMVWDDSLKYLRNASLRTASKGVFARNLSLTRMVNGPMCFGEALYQDNIEECVALNGRNFRLPGMQSYLPDRIKDAVDAYVSGVLNYAKGN